MSKFDTRILVVDDYNTMRRIVRGLLEQIGFKNNDEDRYRSGGAAKAAQPTLRPRHFRTGTWSR